jgi:hypothetical protein
MNVFLIETPLQLLNAIEARNHFKFKNNILLILLTNYFGINSFNNLVDKDSWDTIRYIPFLSNCSTYDFGMQRPQNLYERCIEYYIILQQLLKRCRLDKIIKSIGSVNNIILGNYLQGHKDYMRHFGNSLTHEKIYIVDDGTDTILINRERINELSVVGNEQNNDVSWLKKVKRSLRESYIDWNGRSASSITFFSCYDLSVTAADTFVKNEYSYLRKIAQNSANVDEVIFLGQCLIEDGYISKENYQLYLLKVKEYFKNEKLIYVPHPRESMQSVEYLKKTVGIEIRKLSTPIEYEIAYGGKRPKYLSSFFCSALENCLLIMDKTIHIKSFYLCPQHLLRHKNSVQEIYIYFETKVNPAFEVIKFDL